MFTGPPFAFACVAELAGFLVFNSQLFQVGNFCSWKFPLVPQVGLQPTDYPRIQFMDALTPQAFREVSFPADYIPVEFFYDSAQASATVKPRDLPDLVFETLFRFCTNLSRTVGMPSRRTPDPSALGISFRRTG